MLSASEIKSGLGNFYCTLAYHRLSPIHGSLVCTDGVKWLAESADAFWLVDAIASYQPQCRKDKELRYFQAWKLAVKDGKAVLTCDDGNGNIKITQNIEFTDFPLAEMDLWAEAGEAGDKPVMVLLCPQEH